MTQHKTGYQPETVHHSQDFQTDHVQRDQTILETFTTKLINDHPNLAERLNHATDIKASDATWLDPDHPDSRRVLNSFQSSYAAEEELPRWIAAKLITDHLTAPITTDLEHYHQESIKEDPVPGDFRSHHWSTPIHIMAKLDMASLNMEHNLVPFPLEYALYRISVNHSRASRNPEL